MISEEKRTQFLGLYSEFVHEYLSQARGHEHLRFTMKEGRRVERIFKN
jgi:hypothetical protein